MSAFERHNGHFRYREGCETPRRLAGDEDHHVPKVLSKEPIVDRRSPPQLMINHNPIRDIQQQNWITNTASTLESNGVVLQRFSSSETRGPPQLTRKPILPDDRVNCAYCGTTGEVDEYYAKSSRKEFCSINCLKAATRKMYEIPTSSIPKKKEPTPEQKGPPRILIEGSPNSLTQLKQSPLELHKLSPGLTVIVDKPQSISSDNGTGGGADVLRLPNLKAEPKMSPGVTNTFDWTLELESCQGEFFAAPVSSFRHVPVRGIWENVQPGMKLEVENRGANHSGVAFWVASVIRIHGYKVLLRFEGYGTDSSRDFWANLCLPEVHPVGWCATQNKPLIPPSALNAKNKDWREFLVKRLTGARTIPQNFHEKVNNALKSKYEIGTELEVVDKSRISRVRLAKIVSTMGKRLRLIYYHEENVQDDFWCHENSSLIHPTGWARAVGQEIYAPNSYDPPDIQGKMKSRYSHLQIEEGMKLEAVDPLNLSVICAATIKKVLKYDYVMVRVDCYEEDMDGSDWFCYELTSPSIFPCGFCASHGIPLIPPNGYSKESFNWTTYHRETKSKPAPIGFTRQKEIAHGFKEGMRLEAADLMDPRLICVATISTVIGNLMKIHFDGWEEEYDQWLDATSPDIYPIGWCELVRHRLEAPPQAIVAKKQSKVLKKKAKKGTLGKRAAAAANPAEQPKEKTRKLVGRTVATTQKIKPNEPKPKIPPVVIPKRILGTIGSDPLSAKTVKFPSDSSTILPSPSPMPPPTPPNSRVPLPTDHNGNRNGQGTANTPIGETNHQSNLSVSTVDKIIPKLSDSPTNLGDVDPCVWEISDVSDFLRINDCGAYCDSFERNKIDGNKLLNLTKDQMIVLTGIKVGPAVKILDMISQLKRSANIGRMRKTIFP